MGFLTILIIMIVLLSFFRLLGRMLAARRQTSADSSPERNTLAGMFSTRRVDAEVWMACAANTDLEYIRPQNGKGFPCLRGNVNGRLTDVHIQEEDGSCCTVASVLFRAPEKAGLRILLDDEPVLRAFFAGQPAYRLSGIDDPRLRCAASSENALSEALTPVRMNILKNALGFFRYLNVTDQYVMIRVPGICNDEDALVHLISFIISFAGNWEKGQSAFPAGPILVEHAEPVPELKTPKTAPPSSEPVPEREVEFKPESAEEEKEEIPAVPEQEIEPETEPEPEAVSESVPAGEPLEQTAFASRLFASSFPGEKERKLFADAKGIRVEWSGVLRSANTFGSDFVLGRGPAVKASFEIAEVSGSYSMKSKIRATVRLPESALPRLKNRTGETFRFSGVLEKMEPYARELILLDGELL